MTDASRSSLLDIDMRSPSRKRVLRELILAGYEFRTASRAVNAMIRAGRGTTLSDYLSTPNERLRDEANLGPVCLEVIGYLRDLTDYRRPRSIRTRKHQ